MQVTPTIKETYVRVFPLTRVDDSFWYAVSVESAIDLVPGLLVNIPLGRRAVTGVVWEISNQMPSDLAYLKPIKNILHPRIILNQTLIALAKWISNYYGAPLGATLESMVPKIVCEDLKPRLEKQYTIRTQLTDEELEKLQKKSPLQAEIYKLLIRHAAGLTKSFLKKQFPVLESAVKGLEAKALIDVTITIQTHDFSVINCKTKRLAKQPSQFSLNKNQERAVTLIEQAFIEQKFKVYLLHGITGSGKTFVYINLIQKVLQAGGSAIVLVPEIALVSQMVMCIQEMINSLGHPVLAWHSNLSKKERLNTWHQLSENRPVVLVGARSAVLVPVYNLQLVIVDEEHEPAYKQEETPSYHGRDVAIYRAKLSNAACVLGSATPSLESFHNVQNGKYTLIQMLSRVDDRSLPRIQIVNMNQEAKEGASKGFLLSRDLVSKMRERIENKEQAILFINRRGYASTLLCGACGHIENCPYCSVTLTYHKVTRLLKCHWCSYQKVIAKACSRCKAEGAYTRSFGTQKIEEIVSQLVPNSTVVRLDGDVMQRKQYFEDQIQAFRDKKIDILIGTQLLAKGLDFPNVTLVGVVEADLSLYIQDFRSAERTFQLLVQVAGRAGRGQKPGEVVIQTFLPQSPSIQFARKADFEGFFKEELHYRETYFYPPFSHMIRYIFKGANKEKTFFCANQWAKLMVDTFGDQLTVRGPAMAPVERIKNYYRVHVCLFVSRVSTVASILLELRKEFVLPGDVSFKIDVDPMDLS
jgi:primosomal protein N' (replication factor Y)